HKSDWREGRSAIHAARVNQPLVAFRTTALEGPLGRTFSLLHVSNDQVRISAVKKAEDGDEVIVRLRELSGRPARGIQVALAKPIKSAREVDGQEREIGKARLENGALLADIGGFELRAYAIRLGTPPAHAQKPQSNTIDLPYDTDVASTNAHPDD